MVADNFAASFIKSMIMNIKIVTLLCLLLCWNMKATAQCGPATNLNHQFVGAINIFSWDPVPNAIQYELIIVESGAFAAPESLVTVTTNSFSTAGGLLSATYDYWIVTTCQNGDIHTSPPFTFTIPCPEPTNLTTSNVTETSATLNWSNPYVSNPAYGQVVDLAYRPVGGNWISLGSSVPNMYNLSNLTPGTAYEWCVNLNCPYFDSAPVFGTFTTLNVPCPVSTFQNLLNITNTAAQLNWAGVPGASSFTIQYKPSGSSTWTTLTTTNSNTSYTLTGLSANTSYDWRLATNCAFGQSAYSPITTFTTNCVSIDNSVSFIQYAQVKTLIRPSGAEPGGYVDYFAPVDAQAGSTVSVRVRAGFVGSSSAHDFAIYLDHNRNGVFEYSERVGGNYYIGNTSIKNYTITVPAGASLGHARLRLVLLKRAPGMSMSACVPAGAQGEVEDYWLNITAPAAALTAPGGPESNTMVAEQTARMELAGDADHAGLEVVLSPNPTTGNFTIQANFGIAAYSIFYSGGSLLVHQDLSDQPMLVDVVLDVVPDGIYFVKVTDGYGVSITSKLIVKN